VVNGGLKQGRRGLQLRIERVARRRRPTAMEETPQQTTAATRARPSIRAGLLSSVAISSLALWIAAFEMPFADLPSGFVLFPLLPLTALAFLACGFWSVFLLVRVRRHGVKFASPLMVCALTLAALAYAPFAEIWLQANFRLHRADRERIVALVEAGELTPNVAHNRHLIALGDNAPHVSVGGNDVVIDQAAEGVYVLFLTSRGIRHYFSGFLHVPPGGDPAKFFEFDDQPPKRSVRYDGDWYFVAN
jgi:hypothetical protein